MLNTSYKVNMLDWKESVYSDGSEIFFSIRNPKIGDIVTIKVRFFKDAPIEKIFIRYLRNGEERVAPMTVNKTSHQDKFVYYSFDLPINQPFINYHFILSSSDRGVYFYNQAGLFQHVVTEENDFKIIADFQEPDWTRNAIFYQIFVERFFNGNEKNDIKDGDYIYRGYTTRKIPWGNKPGNHKEFGAVDFYGGDLEGVKAKISYLKALGVNSIYLNPIFTAATTHKYDCNDYRTVDKCFGGEKALIELVEELHENDMKIILDISINHTGDLCKWIQDKPEFYFIKPDGTAEGWSGSEYLLTLNYSSSELQDEIYRLEDSVLKHWMKAPFNIDGWRFDVGQNVAKMNLVQKDKEVWREIRKELKSLNPNAYLFTEHMYDCRQYLQGDMWDGFMNYMGFLRPVRKYLGEFDFTLSWVIGSDCSTVKNGKIFRQECMNFFAGLPYQIQRNAFNLIGSHDISRFHTSENMSKANALTAMVMLLTFIGIPCIYYGDEVRLPGETGDLEFCRYPMEWDENKWDVETFKAYKRMIALRNSSDVLKNGGFKMLLAEDKAISYARFTLNEAVIFVNSQYRETKTLEIPVGYLGNACKPVLLYGNNNRFQLEGDILTITLEQEETVLLSFALL